jgi:hypothetical protein
LFSKKAEETNQSTSTANAGVSSGLLLKAQEKPSSSFFGSTNLATGNLFGVPANSSNALGVESKPSASGFFGTGSGFSLTTAANPSNKILQSKPAVENPREIKDVKINDAEEKKDQAAKEPIASASSSLFGNLNKANEPAKTIGMNVTNLFGNAATSASSDAKNTLFGGPSSVQPSGETKSNLFSGIGLNYGSSNLFGSNKHVENNKSQNDVGTEGLFGAKNNLFGSNKHVESNNSQNDVGNKDLFGAKNKSPQISLNQGLFNSVANKPEEKTEIQKDSQPSKHLLGSCKTTIIYLMLKIDFIN